MLTLAEWLTFADRDTSAYRTVDETFVHTDELTTQGTGNVDAVGWRVDEWYTRSILVPHSAPATVLSGLSVYDAAFDYGWNHEDQFCFGDHREVQGVRVRPWCFSHNDPLTGALIVELRSDFRRYHLLKEQEPGRYWHPLDGVLVAEVATDTHEIYNPTPRVKVHRHHLRDYLAAREWDLIVLQVADRFANVATEEELGITATGEVELSDGVTIQTVVQPLNDREVAFRGRGTLWRSLRVEPYESPKYENSPWPYMGPRRSDAPGPTFVIGADGSKGCLDDPRCPRYLYFHPSVLQRYLTDSSLRVYFHMRTWGIAAGPGGTRSVDVGINEVGLATAFAPDIQKLPAPLQQHWASFSRIPAGGVCYELYETRMQLRPPHSPSVVETIRDALTRLDGSFNSRYGSSLLENTDPPGKAGHLTVGPVTDSEIEFLQLCKVLYRWIVEGMSISALRQALAEGQFEDQWRQIRLLGELLPGSELPEALRGLNDFRVADAHILEPDVESALRRMGLDLHRNLRERWLAVVDRLANLLVEAAHTLGQGPSSS